MLTEHAQLITAGGIMAKKDEQKTEETEIFGARTEDEQTATGEPTTDPVQETTDLGPDGPQPEADGDAQSEDDGGDNAYGSESDKPIWNVETHGKPSAAQREFYRVVGG